MNDKETRVADLRRLVADFVAAREWQPYHQGKNLAMSIAIEAAELMEHFQWQDGREVLPSEQLGEVAEELADIVIYCLSFCNAHGIDLAEAVEAKVRKNEGRFPAVKSRLG
ncbi:nucleotide pyrophosphohydrolase [Parachitinimonas caeni]|uniref:Nucleotide pyrophosphohydrolase n=1 Tax=Parachitinimonas caeni TaxID=3031301 RepID=A0ABT7E0K7_9NEIS|nr:nucleotide pyrophosphohydrolase [Parachitinimonas caeni]MDK2125850.1 nucleotide pyrophosphohydrolase [Parachitinimonas caeni]